MSQSFWTDKLSRLFIWSWTEELMRACWSFCQKQNKGYKTLKRVTWRHESMLSDSYKGKKKPTENNQSNFSFSWFWFHLVGLISLLLCSHWWSFRHGIERSVERMSEWHWRLLNSHEALQRDEVWHPATCGFLCVSRTGPTADRIRLVESLKEEVAWIVNLDHMNLLCWQRRWDEFCHNRGLPWTSGPCPMKYWSLFLWIVSSCTCTCFTLCLSPLSFL